MEGKYRVFGVLLGLLCLNLKANSMSLMVQPVEQETLMSQENVEGKYMEKLEELKRSLIEKMRTMSNILEYIDSYAKVKSKTPEESKETIEKLNSVDMSKDPYVLSKVDVWLENSENPSEIPMDLIGSILDATFHERYKRSPGRRQVRGKDDDEEDKERGDDDDDDKKRRRRRKMRRKSRY